ncbi:MAG: PP2C family serine/threonine-protein phosphatase [Planctomycetota bacterium]|nr:PP2C family serine/threonine-protein phosphatase [Planctomycetota bacterium]
MPPTLKSSRWRVIASTQRGSSHVRQDLPNQDAAKSFPEPSGDSPVSCGAPPVVLAVADGHGSAKSFRSKTGADFAVDVAVSVCREFLEDTREAASPSAIKSLAERQLPCRIVERWKETVEQHFQANPFQPEELERLDRDAGAGASQSLTREGKHLTAYGSTLLVTAIGNGFIVYLQLGDGEILVVSDATGEVSQPIDRDPTLIANETTSLCMDKAQEEFRFHFQYLGGSLPGIVLLSTDGYPNSFRSRAGFLKVGADLLEMLRAEGGGDAIQRDLPGWLQEATAAGSGDDATVGIVYRMEPRLALLGQGDAAGHAAAVPSESSEAGPIADGALDSGLAMS